MKESEASLTEHLFLHNGWIDPQEAAEIPTSGEQIATPLPQEEQSIMRRDGSSESSGEWVVWTHTGKHEGGDTDTTVSIVFVGTSGASETLPLKYQGEDDGDVISKRFLSGAVDVFRVRT